MPITRPLSSKLGRAPLGSRSLGADCSGTDLGTVYLPGGLKVMSLRFLA